MIGGLGLQEIIIVIVVIAILFGARKIPDIMKGIGEGIRELKKGIRE